MQQLTRYSVACKALADAKAVDEVQDILGKADMMRAYAKQANNRQLETDAAEIRIRAERRLGQMLTAQKDTVGLAQGRRSDLVPKGDQVEKPTLAEVGIDKKQSSRAQRLAAVPEEQFEGMVGEWRGRIAEENERVTVNLLKEGERQQANNHRAMGTGENEWYTPEQYLAAARVVLGEIDLDPASSDAAQEKVQAARYFTREQNGLVQEWHGRVWLNPPYTQPDIANFSSKMVAEYRAERCQAAVMLTHNYTDTGWFHELAGAADAICFTRGRIKFYSADGDIAAPTQGQAFSYFGKDGAAFAREFKVFGLVVKRWKR